jgi:hypothetical protein
MSKIRGLAQPSEVAEPVELLRAGAVLHARGMINSRVIQHNLDWMWPYWVRRQFDPLDPSFIPRAFSLTHINLTHRNWTAVGLPDVDALPIVDPQGLVTPHWDGWSLDVWVTDRHGRFLWPQAGVEATQAMACHPHLLVSTEVQSKDVSMGVRTFVQESTGQPFCMMEIDGTCTQPGYLVVSLRPCNPEGVRFVHDIAYQEEERQWQVDGQHSVVLDTSPDRYLVSDYQQGDVALHLGDEAFRNRVTCPVGLCTAAAMYALDPGQTRHVLVQSPLTPIPDTAKSSMATDAWESALSGRAHLRIPDERMQGLYERALRVVVLHAPGQVYPGPYTYKRFWYRDAVFIAHALMACGLRARVHGILDRFDDRQTVDGFFHSQEGEWDANGQVLWGYGRFCQLFNQSLEPAWAQAVLKGAKWLLRKRLPRVPRSPHAGLLPPGFSAEHFGPNDFYYWDDFWAVAGLRMIQEVLDGDLETAYSEAADTWMEDIETSLAHARARLGRPAMPASPYRRLDSGAIGCLVAGYPCQLFLPNDERLQDTADYLYEHCRIHGAFYHDMTHSGINAYLTLHLAQVLMRSGDVRFATLVDAIADLASPTGQWPEAIHPQTRGGCMGDGQHVWAAAEWLMLMRNSFVREELDHLVLGAGIIPAWLKPGQTLSFGPAPTRWGPLEVFVEKDGETATVRWQGGWFKTSPSIQVALPGWKAVNVPASAGTVRLTERTIP